MQRSHFRLIAHGLAAVPLLIMVGDTVFDRLGADPVRTLTLRTGWWALTFLLLSLCMTPLRRVTQSGHWLAIRRMLGLWSFALASLHLSIYVVLDLQAQWSQIFIDIVKRPYITVGFTAWVLLLPMAITSNKLMMRKLGRRWAQLHRMVYLIAVLAVLHFVWLVKKDLTEPLIFAGLFGVALGSRLLWSRSGA